MANSEEHDLVAEKQVIKRGRGRPKCFDEQQALHKAMLLFWEFGYEATSMSDLTKALNLLHRVFTVVLVINHSFFMPV